MKQIPLILCLMASPAMAQDAPAEDLDQGFSLLQEGAKLLLRGMVTQMEPALDDMAQAWGDAQPKLMELLAMIDDVSHYDAPEMLENGDIIIRRKPLSPAPKPVPQVVPKVEGETEL